MCLSAQRQFQRRICALSHKLSCKFYRGRILQTISATVHQGTKRDAILFAIEVNQRYGVRLRTEDKQRIVKLFLADPEWAQWSNVEIAKQCGVGETTVRCHREVIFANGEDRKPSPKTPRKAKRKGKTYVMQTEAIGKPAEPKTEPEATQETLFETVSQPATINNLLRYRNRLNLSVHDPLVNFTTTLV